MSNPAFQVGYERSSRCVRVWHQSRTAGPNVYYERPPIMPRIPDVHLQSIVFIYPTEDAARQGERVGGTGFIVNVPTGVAETRVRYVVTNQHVVDGGGHWVRLNDQLGVTVVHITPDQWISSSTGDDFTVALLYLPRHVVPYELSSDSLALTREDALELRVGPGDEVYMVGRYIGHGGRVSNNPIARFGSVALMPDEHERVLDGRSMHVEAYLVEMRSHSGFSGSPVFLTIPANSFRGEFGYTDLDDNMTRFRLLGIDTGHKVDRVSVQVWNEEGHLWITKQDESVLVETDVAIVSPIWKLVDLLNREDLAEDRRGLGHEIHAGRMTESAASDAPREAT